jgi:hypothetical protein
MYVKNLEIYASNGHAQILEKLNKAHMPIDREEAMCKNRYFNIMPECRVVPGSSVELEQCPVSGAMPP